MQGVLKKIQNMEIKVRYTHEKKGLNGSAPLDQRYSSGKNSAGMMVCTVVYMFSMEKLPP